MSIQDDIISLTDRIRSLKKYILACNAAYGLIFAATIVFAAVILANLLHAAFYLPVWLRAGFSAVFVTALLAAVYKYVLYPILFAPSLESVSLLVEKRYSHLENRLIASLQLEKNLHDNRENYSQDMIRALIRQTSGTVEGLNLKQSHSNAHLKKLMRYFVPVGVAVVLLAVLTPGLFESSFHVFSHPLTEIERQKTYDVLVTPGDVEILKSEPLDVNVAVVGEKLPDDARIFWNTTGAWRSADLEKPKGAASSRMIGNRLGLSGDSVAYKYRFPDVKHDFKYYVQAGREQSEEYAVSVVDNPRVNGLKLTYIYPKYTRMKPVEVDENDGTIQALLGTTVNLELRTNKPVEEGKLVFADGKQIELDCSDTVAAASIKVRENSSYHAEVTDFSGYSNLHPIEYRISALEDAHPELFMVSPGGNVDLGDDMAVRLMANLSDDFGFSRLVLHYTTHMTRVEHWSDSIEIGIAKNKTEQQADYFWDLSNAGLVPGSWIEYYLEVYDNDYISGPKSTRGPVMAVRLPTLNEQFAMIESSREDQLEEYIEALHEQREVQQAFEKLSQDIKQDRQMNWEQTQDLESAVERQQKLYENFDELAKEFEEINRKAKEQDLMTLQMMQKIHELQKLFEEVATEEMRENLRKLQEAMAKLDKDEVEKALEDMKLSTEDILENLERSIAQLKRMKVEQKMQQMIRRAEQILKEQQSVNEQTKRSESDQLSDKADKEERVKESFEDLKAEADDLQSMMEEAEMQELEQAQEFRNAIKQSDAEQDMQQMIASLTKQDKQNSMQSGENAEQKLSEMLDKMNEMQQQMSSEMGAELAKKMRKALDDVFYLSEKQEDLYRKVEEMRSNPSGTSELAEEQQLLQSHAKWLDQHMFELSKESVFMQKRIGDFMGKCMSHMGQATKGLSGSNGQNALNSQRDAMFSLNQASRMIMESLNSQKQCNSSCSNPNQSMFKKMGSLSKQQRRINQQTQSMCNNPSQTGQSNQQKGMERLATEQSAIQKSIQELQNEHGGKRQIKGRLENMQQEMDKIVEALESGSVDQSTLDRQNKIYQRMLDFQLAMERQDYSEQRRAETGADVLRRGPDAIDQSAQLGGESYEKRLQQFLDEGYPEEYEALIKDYFKAIMQSGN